MKRIAGDHRRLLDPAVRIDGDLDGQPKDVARLIARHDLDRAQLATELREPDLSAPRASPHDSAPPQSASSVPGRARSAEPVGRA